MQFKLLVFNLQDFFLPTDYPLQASDLVTMTETEWQLLSTSKEPLKPLSKIRQISSIITETDPDLVCLTEVGGQKALELFATFFLDSRYQPFLIDAASERGIQNGFLLKSHAGWKARIESHRDWPVPFTYPHEDEPEAYPIEAAAAPYHALGLPQERVMSRDMPALIISRDKRGSKPLLIVLLVHLKSGFDQVGIDPAGRVRRSAELKAVLRLYQKLQSEHKAPIIVAGDFNGEAGRLRTADEFLPLYAETDLEDVLELAEKPAHERLSQFTFIRTGLIAQQLDYIFLPKVLQSKLSDAYVYRYKFASEGGESGAENEMMFPFSYRDRNLLPSDHYPVVASLNL